MKKHSNQGNSDGKQTMSIAQIEHLFVEKLQEKYQLTTRDIQRAFKRFDKDGSGLLSITELTRAIRFFLNGVDEAQVQELANRYDVDGDGEISLDEFSQFLLSRNAINPQDWLTVDHLTTNNKSDRQRPGSSSASGDIKGLSSGDYRTKHTILPVEERSASVSVDTNDGTSIEYQVKVFLNNMKLFLLRKFSELRNQGKLSFQERAGQHFTDLAESKARTMMLAAFQPYTQGRGTTTVDFPTFKRVLAKYVYPGSAPPKDSILEFLFAACAPSSAAASSSRCDPDILVDIMFSSDTSSINKFGFSEPSKAPIDTGRPDNARGPFRVSAADGTLRISDVPFRFITRKCRTSLATPSNFNINVLRRSAALPEYACQREHVIGLNSNLNSGNLLYSMTSMANPGSVSNDASGDDDASLLLYSAAAIGVVHNINSGSQKYFDGHTDDISCVAVSVDRSLAATGQVGKEPEVLVWSTTELSSGLVTRIGKGFFGRGVCAVEFTFDAEYIVGVGCDDHHSLGVWRLSSGQLVASVGSCNGSPPMVKCLGCSPMLQSTAFISEEHANNPCDIIVSGGDRHLRFWSFQRPLSRDGRGAALVERSARFGKVSANTPSQYTCVGFTSPRAARGSDADQFEGVCDVVSGGDNGFLYLWRGGLCIRSRAVIPHGRLICLQVHRGGYGSGDLVFCGGAGGLVVVADANSLDILQSYCVISGATGSFEVAEESTFQTLFGAPIPNTSVPTAKTAPRARPASAGRMRPSSASSSLSTRNVAANRTATSARAGDIAVAASPRATSQTSSYRAGMIAAGAASKLLGKQASQLGTKRQGSCVPKDAWVRPGKAEEKELASAMEGVRGSANVTGIALVYRGRNVANLVVATGFGKVIRINLQSSSGAGRSDTADGSMEVVSHFHYGSLWAVSVLDNPFQDINLYATGGDDRWLCLWDGYKPTLASRRIGLQNQRRRHSLLTRTKTQGPIRAIDMASIFQLLTGTSKSGNLLELSIAIGFARGRIAIYLATVKRTLSKSGTSLVRETGDELQYDLRMILTRKDCAEDISEIKYSPNAKMLAVGSHDNYIDIYHHKAKPSSADAPASIELKYLKRLRGHSSYITHLDWSSDNRLIKSTCGAYELLYWDVSLGKQVLSSLDTLEADAAWYSHTCALGFEVMGIFPPDADGTDVNSVDVSEVGGVVATGDDFGKLNLYNFPCVAARAPAISMSGHSSHVMCVKFLSAEASQSTSSVPPALTVVTAGGNDCSAMIWSIRPRR